MSLPSSIETHYPELVKALVRLNIAFAKRSGYGEKQIDDIEQMLSLLEEKLVPVSYKKARSQQLIEHREDLIDQLASSSHFLFTQQQKRDALNFFKKTAITLAVLMIGFFIVDQNAMLSLRKNQSSIEVASVLAQDQIVIAQEAQEIPEHPLEPLAENGDAFVQYKLASLYIKGLDVEQSYKRARYWFEKAANQGVAGAQYNLAVMLHQKLGVEQDLETAIYWYEQAANQGHAEAAYNLASLHMQPREGKAEPNYIKAKTYFVMAFEAGIIRAAHDVGQLYENGYLATEPNFELARDWYNKSAAKGYAPSFASISRLADEEGQSLNRIETAAP